MIRQGLGAGEKFRNSIISSGTTFNPTGGMITIGLDSTHFATQEEGSIAIGYNAVKGLDGINNYSQKTGSIAIGKDAADAGQDKYSIAIGNQAGGKKIQGENSIAIGNLAGNDNQGASAVAIGNLAGNDNQGASAVAIGDNAGRPNQGENSIAIGRGAGQDSSGGKSSIAIGRDASAEGAVGENTIAIGVDAGLSGSGIDSIMIGSKSSCMRGSTPISNSIVLNATGLTLTANANNAFHVAPIRNSEQRTVLGYDTDKKEITYFTAPIVSLTTQNIPILSQSNQKSSPFLSYISATTERGIYGNNTNRDVDGLDGRCPPNQIYSYNILKCNGSKLNDKDNNEVDTILPSAKQSKQYTVGVIPINRDVPYIVVINGGPDSFDDIQPCNVDVWFEDPNNDTSKAPYAYKLSWSGTKEWITRLRNLNDNKAYASNIPGSIFKFGIPLLNNANHTI